jgi:hypothetical protein
VGSFESGPDRSFTIFLEKMVNDRSGPDSKDPCCINRQARKPVKSFRNRIELAFHRERNPGRSTSSSFSSHSEFLRFGIEFSVILADRVGRLSRGEADLGAVNFSFADVFCGFADRDVSRKFDLSSFFVFFCFDVQRDLLNSSSVGTGSPGKPPPRWLASGTRLKPGPPRPLPPGNPPPPGSPPPPPGTLKPLHGPAAISPFHLPLNRSAAKTTIDVRVKSDRIPRSDFMQGSP